MLATNPRSPIMHFTLPPPFFRNSETSTGTGVTPRSRTAPSSASETPPGMTRSSFFFALFFLVPLVPLPVLSHAFRKHLLEMLEAAGHNFDPTVTEKDWGVHIQPFGSGANAIKYLGTYVCRTAIADSRILRLSAHEVTFRWKDREHGNRLCTDTIPGVEFVARYLRHVLPRGLRAVLSLR